VKHQPFPAFKDAAEFGSGVPTDLIESAINHWVEDGVMNRMGLGELTVCLTQQGIAEIESCCFPTET
jgi:hypothetical protein